MATSAEGTRETSPLLANDRETEAQLKRNEDERTATTWRLVTGIGFTWLASWLAALGKLLSSSYHSLAGL